ncbi:hypothetical protein AB1N83_004722 [Pleurotus pulmonarius]
MQAIHVCWDDEPFCWTGRAFSDASKPHSFKLHEPKGLMTEFEEGKNRDRCSGIEGTAQRETQGERHRVLPQPCMAVHHHPECVRYVSATDYRAC